MHGEMQVCDVVLRNALSWLHGCCVGIVFRESPGSTPCVFPCKVAAAGGRMDVAGDWFWELVFAAFLRSLVPRLRA